MSAGSDRLDSASPCGRFRLFRREGKLTAIVPAGNDGRPCRRHFRIEGRDQRVHLASMLKARLATIIMTHERHCPVWMGGHGTVPCALAVLAGWNVRRVEIPWVRWCSECATAEHPFKLVRTSFHTACLGVKHPSHRGAPWCNGATARRRLRVLRVTCDAGDVRCRP